MFKIKTIKKGMVYLFLSFLILIPLTLSGCNKTSDELKIALDIEDEGRYDELFSYYTSMTGITVKATYGQDISKLIGTKDEPDIIKTSTVVVESMKTSLLDLTPYIESDPDISTDMYIDSIMNALTIDGAVYALPTSINTSLLYYNKTLFDAKASELRAAFQLTESEDVYPKANWTYADFQKAGVILSDYTTNLDGTRTYTKFGAEVQLNWWGEWLVYVNQMGGSFYQDNSNNHICALNSPQATAATTFFVQKSMGTASQKFAPDAIENASSFSFMSGNVAMIFGGHMGDWYSYDALGINWGIQVLPTPTGSDSERGGEISADAFGISVRSSKVTQAFAFLKMWAGEAGAKQMLEYGKVGALKNMQALVATVDSSKIPPVDFDVVFTAMQKAMTLPQEKDFSKVVKEMVMTEIYKLMYDGRGSETDITLVLTRIKTNVDQYYAGIYN